MQRFAYALLAAASGIIWMQCAWMQCAMAQEVPPAAPAPPPPQFLFADVHVAPKEQTNAASSSRPGQLEMRNVTLLQLIQQAYQIDSTKIFGGPRWLDLNKYVIVGKGPAGTKTQDMMPMLKPLLADRFGLKLHEDQRPYPTYTLTLGKGKHKLKASEGGEATCKLQPPASDRRFLQHLSCHDYALGTFVSLIGSLAGTTGGGRIVDKTGLEGKWDLDLEFTPAQSMVAAGADGISIADAVEKQLGLKLEMQKTPQTVLIIDGVNEMPTPNEPGVEAKLDPPPPPPTLEVATIKPTAPGAPSAGGIRLNSSGKDGAQLEMRGMRLSSMLALAWGDLPTDRIVGLPPGVDDRPYDILAKIQMAEGQGFSFNAIQSILQGLVKERFNVQAHLEDRPLDAYRLVVVKPKMPVADPSNRAGCTSALPPDAKDPREKFPSRSRLVTCSNMTLDEFAERLQNWGSGYLRAPVTNATKLDGMWDFVLNFSPPPPTNAAAALAPVTTAPAAVAADPTADLSLFDAVTSQLGLRLELEKRMMPVLVVDHVDAAPTDN